MGRKPGGKLLQGPEAVLNAFDGWTELLSVLGHECIGEIGDLLVVEYGGGGRGGG